MTLYSTTTMSFPYAIAVDFMSVYWTDNLGGSVMKVPIMGGTATTLAVMPRAYSLAIDATNVYFSGGDGSSAVVGRVPLQGGSTTPITSGIPGVSGLAVDATHVYWGFPVEAGNQYGCGVASARLAGGNHSTLASSALSWFGCVGGAQGLASSGGDVFWADGPAVGRTPADGGTTVTLQAAQIGNAWPASLVTDATNVYFLEQPSNDQGSNDTGLVQQSIAGGAPLILQRWGVNPGGIAVDETWVYYPGYAPVSCDAGPCADYAVLKVPIGGGPRVTVATIINPQQYLYLPIAVDATSVYFATPDGVFKVTPK